MDAASGAAVAALRLRPGDDVLDLCAAPGAKLCMIAEALGGTGSVTGVDVSAPRLAACRTMLVKYGLQHRCRLFLGDGRLFACPPASPVGSSSSSAEEGSSTQGLVSQAASASPELAGQGQGQPCLAPSRRRKTRKERRAAQRLRKFAATGGGDGRVEAAAELFYSAGQWSGDGTCGSDANGAVWTGRYDKVLVDAECTHDGSLKHITKYETWGWDTLERRFLDLQRLSTLTDLQGALLANGFSLLKSGGILVYSTCRQRAFFRSFIVDQNEAVVNSFLHAHPDAELLAVNSSASWPCKPGGIAHSLRFDPAVSHTSGLFLACMTKCSRFTDEG
eukprot:SM000222S06988  [mRNA]  locus=s222:202507:205108:- [translate_table: standard]